MTPDDYSYTVLATQLAQLDSHLYDVVRAVHALMNYVGDEDATDPATITGRLKRLEEGA